MANCNHDPNGICKSCKQTIAEGGTVALMPDVKPAAAPEMQPEVAFEPTRSRPSRR